MKRREEEKDEKTKAIEASFKSDMEAAKKRYETTTAPTFKAMRRIKEASLAAANDPDGFETAGYDTPVVIISEAHQELLDVAGTLKKDAEAVAEKKKKTALSKLRERKDNASEMGALVASFFLGGVFFLGVYNAVLMVVGGWQ